MLLEVLLGWGDELDGDELEAVDGSVLGVLLSELSGSGVGWKGFVLIGAAVSSEVTYPRFSKRERIGPMSPRCEVLGLALRQWYTSA